MLATLLGNYRVVEQLGQGGMGVVYVGRHEKLGHRVVVKVLRPELSRNATIVRRFFNEAQAATAIRNPGIVQVFDFGTTEDGRAYFVMELLEGVTLGLRLEQRRLEVVECCRLARQIANVLQSVHEINITHRDLKPDNLFLVPDAEVVGGERVKVLDFGIAKIAGELQAAGVQTRADLVMGTPSYMSPEQCRGAGAVDTRSDIYSLGCVLFKMVCGRAPFVGVGPGDIIGAHLHKQPRALQELAPDTPTTLAALVARMLEKPPDARPQTMAAVAHALEEILRELTAVPEPGATQPDTVPSRLSVCETAQLAPLSMVETDPVAQQLAEIGASSSMLPTAPVPVQSEPLTAPTDKAAPQDNARQLPAPRFIETMPLEVRDILRPGPAKPLQPVSADAPASMLAGSPAPMLAGSPALMLANAPLPLSASAPLPMAMAMAAQTPPFGDNSIPTRARASSAPPVMATPPHAVVTLRGANPAPRLARAPSAQPMDPRHSTSTTLSGSAGTSSARLRGGASRRPLMIGGLAIAIVAIVTSIALLLGSDSDSSTGAIVSSPPPPSPQPSSSSPQPPPSLPQPPAPTLPTRGETTQTEAPLPPDDLESECNGFQVDHRWAELAQCAAKLTQIAPQRAEALKARAARELETAPHIEAVDAALRDRDLRRASEALGQVWADSLELPELKKRYAAAETQAAAELAGRLGRVMSPTCTGYQELLTKERNVQLPSIITEATRFVPCTPVVRGSCNAKALAEQGRARHSAGKLVPALWSYEASWYCQIDPQTAKRGFIVACNIPNAQKAKQFWKRMSAEMRPTVAASCVNNRITEQQLNAP